MSHAPPGSFCPTAGRGVVAPGPCGLVAVQVLVAGRKGDDPPLDRLRGVVGGLPGPRRASLAKALVSKIHRALSQPDLDIIPTLILFRRLLLVGWVGSHHEYAAEAAELGAGFTSVTCDVAEAYLAGRYLK